MRKEKGSALSPANVVWGKRKNGKREGQYSSTTCAMGMREKSRTRIHFLGHPSEEKGKIVRKRAEKKTGFLNSQPRGQKGGGKGRRLFSFFIRQEGSTRRESRSTGEGRWSSFPRRSTRSARISEERGGGGLIKSGLQTQRFLPSENKKDWKKKLFFPINARIPWRMRRREKKNSGTRYSLWAMRERKTYWAWCCYLDVKGKGGIKRVRKLGRSLHLSPDSRKGKKEGVFLHFISMGEGSILLRREKRREYRGYRTDSALSWIERHQPQADSIRKQADAVSLVGGIDGQK